MYVSKDKFNQSWLMRLYIISSDCYPKRHLVLFELVEELIYHKINYHPERDLHLGRSTSELFNKLPKPLSHDNWIPLFQVQDFD